MEKAHNWVYVRSKNTKSSNRASVSIHMTPQTPNLSTPPSGMMDIRTPVSVPAPSPEMSLQQGSSGSYRVDGMPNLDFQLFPENPMPTVGDFSPFSRPLDFGLFEAALQASDPNEYVPTLDMNVPSIDSSVTTARGPLASGVIDASPREANLNFELNWDTMDNEFTAMNVQLLTPAQSVEAHTYDSFSRNHSICFPSPPVQDQKIPSLSPGGQGNLMLYSPQSHTVDEGFHDIYDSVKPMSDFTLFESPMNSHRHHSRGRTGSSSGSFGGGVSTTNSMFPSLTNYAQPYVDPQWNDNIDSMDMNMDVDEYAGMDNY